MPYDIHDFANEVINRSFSVSVLVDFWAEWCAQCKMLDPILEQLATEKSNGRWVLEKINTEEMVDVAVEYQIYRIPNLKLFVMEKCLRNFFGAFRDQ
jgi:putative thioredoxin